MLKCSIIEHTKFTVQTFPCTNTCCFDFENGEPKWFLPSIHDNSLNCGTLNSVTLSTCMIQSKWPYDASTNPPHGFMETFVVYIYLSIILSQIKPLF